MVRKRKANSLKSKKQEEEEEVEQEQKEEEKEEEQEEKQGNKKIKTPKTLKEKILTILSNSNTLLGLQKIKKLLITEYDMKETKVFNTNVSKTLKLLTEENETDKFGKIGGSYHGGIRSQSYLSYEREQREKQELKKHIDDGEVLCPYCNLWCSDECFVREDSVARGGLYVCEHCSEEFWTWISDGYSIGHKVEYRYGDGSDDYADLNRGKRR